MKKIPVYRSTIGLTDRITDIREVYNAETFVVGLDKAENVIYDVTGAIKVRPGFTTLTSGSFHSLFSIGAYGVCVKDKVLHLINEDLSLSSLGVNINGKKVAYEHVHDGLNDTIFFSDTIVNGLVVGKGILPWTVQEFVGNLSTEAQVTSYLPSVPLGHILRIFNGRMYIAVDNLLFVSEPYAYSWYNPVLPFIFDSYITAVHAITAGLLVSTTTELFLMAGDDCYNFAKIRLLDAGVILGSDISIPATNAGTNSRSPGVVFAVANKGVFMCDENGTLVSLTEDKTVFPNAGNAAVAFLDYRQYIISLM